LSELLLGIDIGTASTKAVLSRADGGIVAQTSRPHSVSLPRPGYVEHDADAIWWSEVVSVCRELVPAADAPIAAIGLSGIGPCVVPCTANDEPLRPAILYGIDTRATREVDELTELLGEDEILQRCGSVLSSQALGPKLAWLRRNEPSVHAATERWHMAHSFAIARLTGEWVLDHHSASQCDPLYDMGTQSWNRAWAELVVPELPLPALAWPSEIVGRVGPRAAEETGVATGTPVIAGTIDSWAEAASVGVRRRGDLMLQYGSTLFLVLGVDGYPNHRSVWTTCGIDPGTFSCGAGLATAGALVEWVRSLCGSPDLGSLLSGADRVPAGAEGIIVLPYFAGERTPILDPDARGTVVGLHLGHSAESVCRAALEGIAFAIRHNLEAMGDVEGRSVAVGGGAQAAVWPQIVSDVTGLDQELPLVHVGASYGAALLAAEGAGLVAPQSSWHQTARILTPDLEKCGLYDELYELYRSLYQSTSDIQHELASLQRR
jgi:xylulokinase